MTVAQWILAVLVALAFLAAGAIKLVRSRDALIAGGMEWAADFSTPAVKLIATLEVIGAAGVILPLATGIAPVLSPLAAIGLAS